MNYQIVILFCVCFDALLKNRVFYILFYNIYVKSSCISLLVILFTLLDSGTTGYSGEILAARPGASDTYLTVSC